RQKIAPSAPTRRRPPRSSRARRLTSTERPYRLAFMTAASSTAPLTIAGHTIASLDRAGGMLTLRVALNGGSLVELARALGRLDGVRVTGGSQSAGHERCYIAHCPGFKLVVSSPVGGPTDFALALVSRSPQAALSITSDL